MSADTVLFFGRALAGVGRVRANQDQARALRRSASYLNASVYDMGIAKKRATSLFDRDIDNFTSQQVSSYAKAGIDVSSGSALSILAQTRVDAFGDRQALREDYQQRINNVRFQASQQREQASQLDDPVNQSLTFVSSLFGG